MDTQLNIIEIRITASMIKNKEIIMGAKKNGELNFFLGD